MPTLAVTVHQRQRVRRLYGYFIRKTNYLQGKKPQVCLFVQYHGNSSFSESEAVAIRDSLAANSGFVKAFVSIHSYGGIWMSPYGYLYDLPPEYDEMVSTRYKDYKIEGIRHKQNLIDFCSTELWKLGRKLLQQLTELLSNTPTKQLFYVCQKNSCYKVVT